MNAVRVFWRCSIACFVVICSVATVGGQPAPPASQGGILRLAGRIATSQEWRGTVWITEDVMIDGAVVTVMPGTVIEFCGAPADPAPVLRFSGVRPGKLILAGDSKQPIQIRSREGMPQGRIEGTVAGGASLTWRHAQFYRVGKPVATRPVRRTIRIEPAVLLSVGDSGGQIELDHCEFEQCANVVIEGLGQGRVTVGQCMWRRPAETGCLEVRGTGALEVRARDNRAAGAVRVDSCAGLVQDNILVGERASLTIAGQHSEDLTVRRNYVHNTTDQDDGSYAATFEDANALVEDNVLQGGTYVIARGARRMKDNVLLAAPRLEGRPIKASRTHHVVSEVPSRSRFERNIVVGPAFSLVCTAGRRGTPGHPAEPVRDVLIDHCVFDGRDGTGRAVHLNRGAREPVGAVITNSLFIANGMAVHDEARAAASLGQFEGNACVPACSTDVIGRDAAAGNVAISDMSQLRLAGEAPNDWAELDGRVEAKGIGDVLAMVRRMYQPTPGSPLCGSGLVEAGSQGATIGAVEPGE